MHRRLRRIWDIPGVAVVVVLLLVAGFIAWIATDLAWVDGLAYLLVGGFWIALARSEQWEGWLKPLSVGIFLMGVGWLIDGATLLVAGETYWVADIARAASLVAIVIGLRQKWVSRRTRRVA